MSESDATSTSFVEVICDFENEKAGFYSRSEALQQFCLDRIVNNPSRVFLYYERSKRRGRWVGKSVELSHGFTLPHTRHFMDLEFMDRGNITAQYAIDPLNQSCKWLGVDIDLHGEDSIEEQREANFKTALEIQSRLLEKGIKTLLECSNGGGGFHIIGFFETPVPAKDLHPFLKQIVKGLGKVECNPKQSQASIEEPGNPLRFSGLHHTKDYVSQFWNGEKWLSGVDAADHLLAAPMNDPSLIPAYTAPEKRPSSLASITDWDQHLLTVSEALDFLPDHWHEDYDSWIRVILALARAANRTLKDPESWKELAESFSSNWEGFDEEEFEKHWEQALKDTVHPRENEINTASLIFEAKENGFVCRESSIIPDDEFDFSKWKGESFNQNETLNEDLPEFDKSPKELPCDPTLYPQTDAGIAERIAARWGHLFRWSPEKKTFLYYTGKRWVVDRDLVVESAIIETLRNGLEDSVLAKISDVPVMGARGSQKPSPREEWIKFCRKNEGQRNVRLLAEAFRRHVPCDIAKFDQERDLLNCVNGVVNLRDGSISAHDSSQQFLTICPVPYNAKATCPQFQSFLKKIFANDQEIVNYIQQLFGYFASGDVTKRLLPIFYGGGSNGKSVLINILKRVLGKHYITVCPPTLITGQNGNIHNDYADLFGKRLAIHDETSQGDILNSGIVKKITSNSGDIKGRNLFEQFIEFQNTCKIIILTNHKPRIPDNSHAMWDRLSVIEFAETFWDPAKGGSGKAGYEVDPELENRLVRQEAEGILTWIVQGAIKALPSSGMVQPKKLLDAKNAYRESQDELLNFLKEQANFFDPNISDQEAVKDSHWMTLKSLREEYQKWGGKRGKANFEAGLVEMGYRIIPEKRIYGSKFKKVVMGIHVGAGYSPPCHLQDETFLAMVN